MLKIFDIIPGWVYAAAVAVLLVLLGAQTMRMNNAQNKVHELRATYADNARKASEAARAEEHRRQTELEGIAQNARIQIEQAGTDALAAGESAVRLRDQLAAYVDRSRKNPAAAAGSTGKPSADPIGMLAQLYGESDDSAEQVSRFADRLRIAGLACEAAHAALGR